MKITHLLESNGSLRTAIIFDYESNSSSYAVRAKTQDENNISVEGNFTVSLNNVNEPPSGSVFVSGNPIVGQTLTATNNLVDPDGLGQITYHWYRNGTRIQKGGTVNGFNQPEDLVLSPDEKYLYIANFGESEIRWFEKNATTGTLTNRGFVKDGVNGDGLLNCYSLALSSDGKNAHVTKCVKMMVVSLM